MVIRTHLHSDPFLTPDERVIPWECKRRLASCCDIAPRYVRGGHLVVGEVMPVAESRTAIRDRPVEEPLREVEVGLCAVTNYPVRELRQFLWWGRLAGVDSLVVPDHWQDFVPRVLWEPSVTWRARRSNSPHDLREAFTVLGALARSAGRVRIGVAVTEMLRRHPVMVAQAALTLSELTKRPLILGVGAGERLNTEPYGVAVPKPVGRFEEALQVIRLCFQSSGTFDFEGEHFQLNGAVMDLAPSKSGTPEIWIAAHGPRMLGLVGRYGDGWIPIQPLHGPADYELGWRTVRTAAKQADRRVESITPSLLALVALAPTAAQAEALLRSPLVRYLALMGTSATQWVELGSDHPFGPDFGGYGHVLPEALDRRELDAAIAQVPPEIVRSRFVSGTPLQVEATIRDYADAGLRHVVLAPVSALVRRRHQNYALWALPRLVRALRRPSSRATRSRSA